MARGSLPGPPSQREYRLEHASADSPRLVGDGEAVLTASPRIDVGHLESGPGGEAVAEDAPDDAVDPRGRDAALLALELEYGIAGLDEVPYRAERAHLARGGGSQDPLGPEAADAAR